MRLYNENINKRQIWLNTNDIFSQKQGQGCVSLKSIAEENNLSDLYLEQLVGPLRNADLIRSVRGAKGGYQLRVSAEEITAGDIIRLLEGPITFVESIDSEPPAQNNFGLE